jgi:methionyl-tRNA formyltransferase
VPALQRLAARAEIVAVVTQPDRPAGRGHQLAATPVKTAALELGLTVLTPTKLKAFAGDLRALAPDLCVVASYGRIVPQALLDVVPMWFNIHPSLLPLYRGATPLQSVLRDGRSETAVSIIAMDAGMDTGDLVAQTQPLAIGDDETYGELHDRLAGIGAELLDSVLADEAAGTRVPFVTQTQRGNELGIDDAEIALTTTRPFGKDDRVLPPYATARETVDRIRSLAPSPGAQLIAGLRPVVGDTPLPQLKILRAHISQESPLADGRDVPSGTVVAHLGYLYVRANDAWIVVDEVVPAGKTAMTMAAFANGRRIDDVYVPEDDVVDGLGALRFRERAGELLAR